MLVMSKAAQVHPYDPRHALVNPTEFYQGAFQNYPRPAVVGVVGRVIMALTRPEVSFHGGVSEAQYFSELDPAMPLLVTYTHRGEKRLHDAGAGAAAIFGVKSLKKRIEHTRVWAAAPYMTDSKTGVLIKSLGGVPVIRSRDYGKFGLTIVEDDLALPNTFTPEEKQAVTDALITESTEHLQIPGSILAAFPAGTKGGTELRDGVGQVMERLEYAAALPVALVSDSEETSNIPKNLRIAFGEPVPVESGLLSAQYMLSIGHNLDVAVISVGGQLATS